jgi:hypothetical protein
VNRTLLDECFRVAGRQTWYTDIAEIQADLDRFMASYNTQRTHQGYRLRGRTPAAALKEVLDIDTLPDVPGVVTGEEAPLTPAASTVAKGRVSEDYSTCTPRPRSCGIDVRFSDFHRFPL